MTTPHRNVDQRIAPKAVIVHDPQRAQERRLVFICLTVLTAVLVVLDMMSDIFIRGNNLKHGDNATSWDWACSVSLLVWQIAALRLWFGKR